MLITEEGTILRTVLSSINRYRRSSRGVTVMRPQPGDRVVAMTVFVDDRDAEPLTDGEGGGEPTA